MFRFIFYSLTFVVMFIFFIFIFFIFVVPFLVFLIFYAIPGTCIINRCGPIVSIAILQARLAHKNRMPFIINKTIKFYDYIIGKKRLSKQLKEKILNEKSSLHILKYEVSGSISDLTEAIDAFTYLLSSTKDGPYYSGILSNLGLSLRKRYVHTGNSSDLNNSLSYCESAVKFGAKENPDYINWLMNLGNVSLQFYFATGNIYKLEQSIKIYQDSLELVSKRYNFVQLVNTTVGESNKKSVILNNLGDALRYYYRHTGNVANINMSVEFLQEALRTATLEDTRRIIIHNQSAALIERHTEKEMRFFIPNLGTVLKHTEEDNFSLLKKTLLLLEKNLRYIPDESIMKVMYISNIGKILQLMYAKENDANFLITSILYFKKIFSLLPENHLYQFTTLFDLGNSFGALYILNSKKEYLLEAIKAYKKAVTKKHTISGEKVRCGINWVRLMFFQEDWKTLVEAFKLTSQAADELLKIQHTRQHKESWLKDMQGLATLAAYAFAKENKFEEATITLERGLAKLLSEALARDRANLEQLKEFGHKDLYDRYKGAVDDWHMNEALADPKRTNLEQLSQHVKEELVRTRLQAAYEELDKTIAAIRKVDGYSEFLTAPNFVDIVTAVKDSVLVYLVVTQAGGLALIVYEGGEITPVWLPELTNTALAETVLKEEKNDNFSGYLAAYLLSRIDKQAWYDSLEKTTQWLWATVMAPLIQALPKSAQVTLIPVGRLGLLPFHAAWTEDNNTPTGKRYALDELTISYAPNARSLTEARKVAHRVTVDHMLAVDEPKPVEASPLPSSEYEVQTVVANFAQHHIFKHEAATRQAILNALANCTVLHFSCHGSANLDKPLESALIMANNEPLTVKDFLDLRLNGVRLATLSACETGIPGMELPDEVVNLPAGLLQAGVAGVVASLWSVSDMSTALLMTKFYQNVTTLWQEQGTQASIAPALQAAQCWLRDATKEELEQRFKELPINSTQRRELRRLFNKIKHQTKPYSDSYYWAAFSAIGV